MAFATEKEKQDASALLVDGVKPKAIAEKLGVKVDLIYTLKSELKKAGKIKAKSAPNAKAKKPQHKKAVKVTDFNQSVQHELERLETEIQRLTRVMKAYEGGNGDFLDAIEKKLQKEEERAVLLRELLDAV